MRKCPYCAEKISSDTVRCPYCDSDVRVEPSPAAVATPSSAEAPVVGEGALRFSHSGGRHLLGFGPDYFGIWDRQLPGDPVGRFARTDEGWREAWLAFVRLEPHPAEISLPGGPAAASPARVAGNRPPAGDRPVSGAWWLLPILFGTLGGIIAWVLTRGRAPRSARNMLLLGFALSLFLVVVFVATGPR